MQEDREVGRGAEGSGRPSLLQLFVGLVEGLKQRSTCLRTHQACVISTNDWTRIEAIGYNGGAAGEANELSCQNVPGNCGCVHAEMNALIKLDATRDDLVLICTQSPCVLCARLIVNSRRIKKVVYLERYRDETGLTVLWGARVPTFKFNADGSYTVDHVVIPREPKPALPKEGSLQNPNGDRCKRCGNKLFLFVYCPMGEAGSQCTT